MQFYWAFCVFYLLKVFHVKHKYSIYSLLSWFLAGTFVFCSCAKQGFPSGGPKDVTPPQALSTLPENQQTHFSETEFYIQFDEYVVLKDADNNVLVSPPMNPKPEIKTKGKGVVVRFQDSLQANTTYIFQFQNAIADFNEGNLLPNYEYVFSTGETMDSMTLKGRVVDALTLKPTDGETVVSVLLCDDTLAPLYQTRCDKNGRFQFNHIKPGNYSLIALKDENKNLKIEKNEAVAFLDGSVKPWVMTDPQDSMAVEDTTQYQRLFISMPVDERQRVTSSDFVKRYQARATFARPFKNIRIDNLEDSILAYQFNERMDTLTLWTNKIDSLCVVLTEMDADTVSYMDTLRLKTKTRFRPVQHYIVTCNFNGKHPYYKPLELSCDYPFADLDSVYLTILSSDSVEKDTIRLKPGKANTAYLDWTPKPGKKYTVSLPHAILKDLYGHVYDSARWSVEFTKSEEYGTLTVNFGKSMEDYCVELMNEKGDVVKTQRMADAKMQFPYLKGGKYRLRVFEDVNGNERWDAGNYFKHQQPERVIYYEKTLEIRENWEFEETWTIEE